jgi:hypothetical protein
MAKAVATVSTKMTQEQDLETKTTKELETIVGNCVRLNKTGDVRCVVASKILEGRKNGDYDMEKTIETIRDHGKRAQFLSYKDVANASGLEWANVFRQINKHLDSVCVFSEARGWPLLASIVVNQQNLSSGDMTPANRKGFLLAAKAAGRSIDIEEAAFVTREQKRVFDWCQTEH